MLLFFSDSLVCLSTQPIPRHIEPLCFNCGSPISGWNLTLKGIVVEYQYWLLNYSLFSFALLIWLIVRLFFFFTLSMLFRPPVEWDQQTNDAQRTNDVIITSLLSQNEVVTSFWRYNDVIITSCVRWVCAMVRLAHCLTTPSHQLLSTAPMLTSQLHILAFTCHDELPSTVFTKKLVPPSH